MNANLMPIRDESIEELPLEAEEQPDDEATTTKATDQAELDDLLAIESVLTQTG